MCPQTLRSMQFVDPNLSFPGGRSSRYEIAAINAKSWRCWRPDISPTLPLYGHGVYRTEDIDLMRNDFRKASGTYSI
jgi:hypothetical protein